MLLVYDITNAQSFDNLEDWLAVIRNSCGDKMPSLSLVANKSQLQLKHWLTFCTNNLVCSFPDNVRVFFVTLTVSKYFRNDWLYKKPI